MNKALNNLDGGEWVANEGAFYTGVYRNVLAECGYGETEINDRVSRAWWTMFGQDSPDRIYFRVGDDMGYMLDTGNNDARTEGMSYGMMMAVQMDDKDVFDRLWKWSKTYMWHDGGRYKGYFAWSANTDGTRRAQGPAPDGEEYYAMALLFASNRWGDGEGIYDYRREAHAILHEVVHKGEDGGIGDPMWEPSNKLIKFVPEADFSDPSYHLPHFYDLFALWGPEGDRGFWAEAATASREYLKLACHPVTGLAPNYAHYDGTPETTRGYHDFYSDAYRVAANVGLDWEWFRGDEWECGEADRIQAFFLAPRPSGGDPYVRYTIDGTPTGEESMHPVGLIATNAMASLAAKGTYAEEAVRVFWDTPLRRGERRYYDNCLYLFALLALSGRYRIWS